MKLIVGLGNPGNNYENTRHNVGFMVIDKLLTKLNLSLDESNFNGQYTKFKYKDESYIVAKPLTYMNLSGNFIQQIMHFYKINIEDIIVISDDLDLPVGSLRFKTTGSSGGHNGLKDIIKCLSTEDFKRIKIGIGRDKNMDIVNYVLQKIPSDQKVLIDKAIDNAVNMLIELIDNKPLSVVINKYKS